MNFSKVAMHYTLLVPNSHEQATLDLFQRIKKHYEAAVLMNFELSVWEKEGGSFIHQPQVLLVLTQ